MTTQFDWLRSDRPLSIAHRGASAYAPGNTLEAFQIAAELGADMWEVDIRMTSDGELIAFHDDSLSDGRRITNTAFAEIFAHTSAEQRPAPRLSDVVELAAQTGTGIYADIKDTRATLPTLQMLKKNGIARAILGAFDPEAAQILKQAESPYPRSVLVPLGAEPFSYAADADIIHLCWERMERPQDMLTDSLFDQAFANGQRIVTWHEEDPTRMAEMRSRPVLGICSDRPELVNPPGRGLPFQIVCHRGANKIAPENTLPALECALAAGFDYIECDLHRTRDGEIIAHHDATLDRTTDGCGPITARTYAELRDLDAGGSFKPHFQSTRLPSLAEVLDLLKRYGGKAYLELKTAPPEPVWRAVCDAALQDRIFFWSFDSAALRTLRALSPDAQIMTRRQDYPSLAEALDELAPAIVEFTLTELSSAATKSEFETVRARGAKVMVATMSKDDAALRQLIAAKPDLANVDHPFTLARLART